MVFLKCGCIHVFWSVFGLLASLFGDGLDFRAPRDGAWKETGRVQRRYCRAHVALIGICDSDFCRDASLPDVLAHTGQICPTCQSGSNRKALLRLIQSWNLMTKQLSILLWNLTLAQAERRSSALRSQSTAGGAATDGGGRDLRKCHTDSTFTKTCSYSLVLSTVYLVLLSDELDLLCCSSMSKFKASGSTFSGMRWLRVLLVSRASMLSQEGDPAMPAGGEYRAAEARKTASDRLVCDKSARN